MRIPTFSLAGCTLLMTISCAFGQDVRGFRNEYLDDFAVTRRQVIQLAKAMPAEKYTWRPGKDVRSVSEVYLHIATGNYLLLSLTGMQLPPEYYKGAVAASKDPMVLFRHNLELEKSTSAKDQIVRMLESSLDAVRDQFSKATDADLDKSADFFGEKTTVRRVYLRILAHVNEHMGQSIAYARTNGIAPPWSQPRNGAP
jgi:uncharacterized damage-inducible protein DinB